MSDRARLWLMVCGALWVLTWGYSFMPFTAPVPEDADYARYANRVQAFLGWQAIAGLIALPIWVIGRGWPPRTGVRRLSAVPVCMALLLLVGILGLVVWIRFWP